MVTVKIEGVVEVDIAEGGHVFMESTDNLFTKWEEIPEETQGKLLALRDAIRTNTQAMVDIINSELSRFIECPSEASCGVGV